MSNVDVALTNLAPTGRPRPIAPGDDQIRRSERQAAKLDLTYGLARTTRQRRGAFALVHQAYVRAGLGEPNSLGLRVTPHQILPTSQVFVGVINDMVVSTVSLIGDGQLGLPMEKMFNWEVQELRKSGERLAEVSCLADRRQDVRRFLTTFRELTRLMAQFARYEGIGSLLITVNPRHVKFYTHYLGFVPICQRIADCPHVQNRPAVALRLEFARIDRERPACYDQYFGEWVERDVLRPYTIGRIELAFLTRLSEAKRSGP
ncbi:MAG TPA: long-chain N-acyl amino acid synthase [Pirellulales bacterium]